MSRTPASLVRLFPFCLLMAYDPCVPGSSKPDPTPDPSDPADTGDTPSDGDCVEKVPGYALIGKPGN